MLPKAVTKHARKAATLFSVFATLPRPKQEEKWVSLTNISFLLFSYKIIPNLSEESGSHSCVDNTQFYEDGMNEFPAKLLSSVEKQVAV